MVAPFLFRVMAQDFARGFYNSKRWKDARKAYISYRVSIDGGVCEVCRKNLGYIVHHKMMLTEQNINNPDISLGMDNLRYECKACHDEEEGHWLDQNGYQKPFAGFDEQGRPIDKRKID